MTNKDFIYYYAKIYNQVNVNTVLMRENWEDKDFDAKYAKYMQEYIVLREQFIGKGFSDDKIIASFEVLKKKRLNSVYTYLFNDMLKRLQKTKGKLSSEKLNLIMKRLNKLRSLDDANFDYLYEIRKIEEEEY
jgi:hypothetical protein